VRDYTAAGDITVAGRELKVDALLDGSIQRARKRIRVTAQLVDARDGATLWAENFYEKLVDIFSLEDSLSDEVVRALSLKLTETILGENLELMAYLAHAYALSGRRGEAQRLLDELKNPQIMAMSYAITSLSSM